MYVTTAKLGLAALLSLAIQSEPIAFSGDYRFETSQRGPDNRPVCTETWSFAADGALTVTSGAEIVRKRFRSEADADGRWLVTESLETNGLPDCMGERSNGVATGERRTYLMRRNSGSIVVCGPPARMDDGVMFVGPTCYGELYPQG